MHGLAGEEYVKCFRVESVVGVVVGVLVVAVVGCGLLLLLHKALNNYNITNNNH